MQLNQLLELNVTTLISKSPWNIHSKWLGNLFAMYCTNVSKQKGIPWPREWIFRIQKWRGLHPRHLQNCFRGKENGTPCPWIWFWYISVGNNTEKKAAKSMFSWVVFFLKHIGHAHVSLYFKIVKKKTHSLVFSR